MTTKLTTAQDGIVEALSALVANATEEDRNTLELALHEYAIAHSAEWSCSSPTLRALIAALINELCDRAFARRVGA